MAKNWKKSRRRRPARKGIRISPPKEIEEGYIRRIRRYFSHCWKKLFTKQFESPYAKRKRLIKTNSTSKIIMVYQNKAIISLLALLLTSSNLMVLARAVEQAPHGHSTHAIYGSSPLIGHENAEDYEWDEEMEGGGCCSYEMRSLEDGTESVFPISESEYEAGGDPIIGGDGDGRVDTGYSEFENYEEGSTTEMTLAPTFTEQDAPTLKGHHGNVHMEMLEMEYEYQYQERPLTPEDTANFKSVLVSLMEKFSYIKVHIPTESGSGERDEHPEEQQNKRKAKSYYDVMSYSDSDEFYEEALKRVDKLLDATVALNAAIAAEAELRAVQKEMKELDNLLNDMIKNNLDSKKPGNFQMFDDLQTDSEELEDDYYTNEELNSGENYYLVETKPSEKLKAKTVPTVSVNSTMNDEEELEAPVPVVAPALAEAAEV